MLKWSSRSVRIWPIEPPKQTQSVRLHPIDGELRVELVGDLARLIGFASDPANQKPGFGINPGITDWLVAGAYYQRYLHLDYTRL